jgi:hypothetical protein
VSAGEMLHFSDVDLPKSLAADIVEDLYRPETIAEALTGPSDVRRLRMVR